MFDKAMTYLQGEDVQNSAAKAEGGAVVSLLITGTTLCVAVLLQMLVSGEEDDREPSDLMPDES